MKTSILVYVMFASILFPTFLSLPFPFLHTIPFIEINAYKLDYSSIHPSIHPSVRTYIPLPLSSLLHNLIQLSSFIPRTSQITPLSSPLRSIHIKFLKEPHSSSHLSLISFPTNALTNKLISSTLPVKVRRIGCTPRWRTRCIS